MYLPDLNSIFGGQATGDAVITPLSCRQESASLREAHRLAVLLVPMMEEGLHPDGVLTPHSEPLPDAGLKYPISSPGCWSKVPLCIYFAFRPWCHRTTLDPFRVEGLELL